ncbi:MAG TPA: hypothetical protein VE445_06420 [Nitrososphaeraceae archaeon]|nr:hypothetical protein [Nitrososphaeraceae archaeon]
MKSKKSIAIVTAIGILLLATTLGGFSPISYAQVEQEIDEAAEQEVTNATDTEQEVVEAAEQEATEVEGSTEQEVVEAAEQEVTNATDADQAAGDEEEQIVQAIEEGALEQAGGEQQIVQAIEEGALEQAGGEDITQAIEQEAIQQAAGVDAIQQIEQVATQIANSSTEAQQTGDIEEAGASTIEQIIEQIALQTGQVGGNVDQIIIQIAQQVASNPQGPVAQAIQQLAQVYAGGNTGEVLQATTQIGTQIAQGQNIQQTLVQVSNQVVNYINNINTNINNYNNVRIHSTSPTETKVIQETVNTLKAEKPIVKVPRIHIEFGNNKERNLILRVLNTQDAKYDMPFSRFNGAFSLNDDEFRVKIIGKGKILSAAVSEMENNGDIGPREFLEKDIRNGKVYFELDDVDNGKYLLDVYIRLSDGSIATFARGSINIR